MKKVEMVEKVTYTCDICGNDITDEHKHVCKVCGREYCDTCNHTVKGNKDMLMSICAMCLGKYDKFKKQMDKCLYEHDDLQKQEVREIYDKWKKESLLIINESLLIKNEGEIK